MEHTYAWTRHTIEQMKSLPSDAIQKIYANFIGILKNGHDESALPGKYKPNWEIDYTFSPMREAFIDLSKQYNVHHYHFGFKMYSKGRDRKYPGDESAGIIHVRKQLDSEICEHVMLDICLDHPSPFKPPFDKYSDLPSDLEI